MFPIILGVAAIALLAGCSRSDSPSGREEPSQRPPPPEPRIPPLSLEPTLRSFGVEQCNPSAARPERFTIQDARSEYCRLSEVLFGRRCTINGDRIVVERGTTLPSVLSFAMDHSGRLEDAGRVTVLRDRLGTLAGLQTYLFSGQACRLDGDGDLIDLIEAHSLYESYFQSADPEMNRAFREGRVGCVLRRGLLPEDHHHDGHGHGSGASHDHGGGHTHDVILTPATLRLNSFPEGTRASDCLIVR